MTPAVVCFVGRSGSGKTTFLEKLIPELSARGYRVGVVKHDIHGFEVDRPDKDSYRLRQAGAWRVGISSPQQFAIIGRVEKELSLAEVVERYLPDVDIVLAEGYKRSGQNKIEICRSERSRELLCRPEELLAVVGDLRFDLPCPHFSLDDAPGVADWLEERFLRRPGPEAPPAQRGFGRVVLRVDGRVVPLKPFVQEMLGGAVRGLLAGLKDAQGRAVELRVEVEANQDADRLDRPPAPGTIGG